MFSMNQTPYPKPYWLARLFRLLYQPLLNEHLGEKTFSEKIMSYRPDCFELIGYQSHEKIKAPLSN